MSTVQKPENRVVLKLIASLTPVAVMVIDSQISHSGINFREENKRMFEYNLAPPLTPPVLFFPHSPSLSPSL